MFCAQSFTHNENVVTVSTSRVSFILPVTMEDFVTLSASVTRVRWGFRLHEVDVSASVLTLGCAAGRGWRSQWMCSSRA